MTFLLVACSLSALPTRAFVTPTRGTLHRETLKRSSSSSLSMMTPLPPMQSTSLPLLAAEAESSWRQYVPLAVSLLVITDILLGSPAANAALSVLRPPAEGDDSNETLAGNNKKRVTKDTRERIDTMALAQQALDKASATTELRRFLDESKTDMDKMRDVQKQLDAQLQEFDAKQQDKKDQK